MHENPITNFFISLSPNRVIRGFITSRPIELCSLDRITLGILSSGETDVSPVPACSWRFWIKVGGRLPGVKSTKNRSAVVWKPNRLLPSSQGKLNICRYSIPIRMINQSFFTSRLDFYFHAPEMRKKTGAPHVKSIKDFNSGHAARVSPTR